MVLKLVSFFIWISVIVLLMELGEIPQKYTSFFFVGNCVKPSSAAETGPQ